MLDLGGGGAEKVLVNLVNNLDPDKYDITIRTVFGKGVNEKFLKPHVNLSSLFKGRPFRGNAILQKILSPKLLYKVLVKDKYDIEIAYMFNTPTRALGGSTSKAKKFAWIHSGEMGLGKFRNKKELLNVYKSFDGIAYVSKQAQISFENYVGFKPKGMVVHNVIEADKIKSLASESLTEITLDKNKVNLCSVGRFMPEKGYERLIKILGRLNSEGISNWHFYLLGTGELEDTYKKLIDGEKIKDKFTFLGYQSNPYKYVKNMDLFVCSSYLEGFSTAVTESIIVETPVLTTECSGMDEIIGDSGAGIIVANNDDDLFKGIKEVLCNTKILENLSQKVKFHSNSFKKEYSILEFENFIYKEN